ncbi:MAG: HAMP domain-containing sensor histidine kinase [Cypionkella sp.]
MRPADLWRHSSFRLALGVTLAVLGALILAGAVGYTVLHRQLADRQDARLMEIFKTLQQTDATDQQDLIDAIAARIAASPNQSSVFSLRNAAGKILVSNFKDVPIKSGWSVVEAATLGVQTDYPYRVFAGDLHGDYLVVGLSNADLDDLAEIILTGFGWSALVVLIAAIAVGTWIASRLQRRLSEVTSTLHRVASGDLSTRLAVSKRGDDLDVISGEINQTLARLGALVEAMRQVSADIAHELRTPLNRLRIHIEGAARNAATGASVEDDLAAAIAQSEAIEQTFSALLRIAQIEAGARREKFAPVDLSDLLGNVGDIYAEVATDAGQTLRCDLTRAAWVLGDKELLTQAFANLIENAIRHCPPGTGITCKVRADGSAVTALVSDNGQGIPANEHDLVLRRLYRLEKSRTTDGTGLGLSLVKAVADLHGAELTLGNAGPGLRAELQFARILGAS